MNICSSDQNQTWARFAGASLPASGQGVGNSADDHQQAIFLSACLMLPNNSAGVRLGHFFQLIPKVVGLVLQDFANRPKSHFQQRLSARLRLDSPDANENGLTHAQRSFAPGANSHD